ncbi:MAG: hypothetical protein V4729_03140 [Pseudomonadota bacterium]
MDVSPGDEGRRQAYLAALGIPLWSTRVDLPGALPAAHLEFVPFVVDAEPGLADASAAGVRPAAAASGAGNIAVAATADAAPAPAGTPVPPVAPVRQVSAAAPRVQESAPAASPRVAPPQDPRLPRLACRVWALAPGLCAAVALDDAPDLSAAEHRLLAAIAQALDAPEPPQALGNLLRWPLNRNPALDHGPEAMQAWLAHALRLPAGRCVAFGRALADHLQAALPDRHLVIAPSLGELLADPAAKRQLWQDLNG